MNKRIQNILAGAVVAVSTVFGVMGSAQAAVVTGDFDPAFGTPFTNLWWKGSVTIYVPDGCLAGGLYDVGTGNICNTSQGPLNPDPSLEVGPMHVMGAQVSLFNGNPAAGGTLVESMAFAPNNLFPFSLNTVRVQNGKVLGIATDYSYAVDPNEPNFESKNSFRFALGFSLDAINDPTDDLTVGGPTLVAIAKTGNGLFFSVNDALIAFGGTYPQWLAGLDQRYYKNTVIANALQAGGGSDNVADLTAYRQSFSGEVPEPSSFVLILAALTALGVSARRRRVL